MTPTEVQRANVDRFAALEIDHAPGQQSTGATSSSGSRTVFPGRTVDFSHGDVDAFPPFSGAFDSMEKALKAGGSQAYSEYRGHASIRRPLASRIARLTGAPVDADTELIITPGTQAALFLALSALVDPGDRVAVVEPDYFANRKIVSYLQGEVVPVRLDYVDPGRAAELDLDQLEHALANGTRTIVFSNPNNPSGVSYSGAQIEQIASLAGRYGAFVVVDQLYCRLTYSGSQYTHLRASGIDADNCVTLLGPSKTESLSGFRIGVAVGSPRIIDRMEKLLSIVSLRAAGYNQSVLDSWLDEPASWLEERIAAHQGIRDDLMDVFSGGEGFQIRTPEAGSYVFPRLPVLPVSTEEFTRILREREKIIVTRGTEFGPNTADSIRLNFSQDHERAIDAARRIVSTARELLA